MEVYLYERKDEAESELSERKLHRSAKNGPEKRHHQEMTPWRVQGWVQERRTDSRERGTGRELKARQEERFRMHGSKIMWHDRSCWKS